MKTQPLKGMRDLLPREQALRDYIQGQILATYRAAGFQRISTPILEDMENLDKSDGGDNLNLIFKVLKRGDKLTAALNTGDPKQLSDMGLRYDLTLPLSRYYAANKDKLPSPFKVIQTDRVFRAERPQKGRLREFVQCDIDILGDSSPNAEVELIDVTTRALLNIGFTGFTVNINDRRILRGMLESMGFAADTLDSVCITFDKMDKIGADGVKAELIEKQLPENAINALADFIAAGEVTLDAVAARCADPAIADDLKYVLATANAMAAGRYQVAYCPSLVRGQGYYTGMVFEITCPQFSGAVAGGGRYDNMVGKFLGTQVPAVGFSIGFERVCGILLEQGYQIPGAKQKIALLYAKDADFPAVLAKAASLRDSYNVTYKLFNYENHMSPDDHFANLKRLIQAVAGKAHRVSVIMPSLYGGRQHRRVVRESLDCAVALQELQTMGVRNIITFDAHDPRVQNAVPLMSFDNAMPTYQVLKSLLKKDPGLSFDKEKFTVVSPDEGAMNRNMYFSSVLGCNLGMFYKRRDYTRVVNGRNPIVAHEYLGESVEGKTVFIADDIIASGESMLEVASNLKERGAANIIANATFPLFTSGLDKFDKAVADGILTYVVGTNLTYRKPELLTRDWYVDVDVSKYAAYFVVALNHDMSVSSIIDPLKKIENLLANRK